MKVSWVSERSGRSGIHVSAGEYDGTPPVGTLWLEYDPVSHHPDRLALAAALAFGGYMSGEIALNTESVSVGVAQGLVAALAPFLQSVHPSHLPQKRFPEGTGTLVLARSSAVEDLPSDDVRGRTTLQLTRMDQASGRLLQGRTLTVSTNAEVIRQLAYDLNGLITFPELAVAVLLAEDLGCDEIVTALDLDFERWRPAFTAAGLRILGA